MNVHLIPFNRSMVCAILADRKIQVRREIHPQFGQVWGYGILDRRSYEWLDGDGAPWEDAYAVCVDILTPAGRRKWLFCPYGKPGDTLIVQEAFGLGYGEEESEGPAIYYRADWPDERVQPTLTSHWRWANFMPPEYSRITLAVQAVRVERMHAWPGNPWAWVMDVTLEKRNDEK